MSTPLGSLADRHLLSLRDLTSSDFGALLDVAERMAGPAGREPLLAAYRFAMVFFNPSLRTRTAFEIAAHDLGSHAVNLQVGGGLWNLEHRRGVVMDGGAAEHVREGFGVLSRMTDALGVRCFAGMTDASDDAQDPMLHAIADAATVPLLSLESAIDHPHQGLADALTVRRVYPQRRVKVCLTWAPHIKPLPLAVAHAGLVAFAHEGHDITVAHPEGFELDEGVMADAQQLAQAAGGSVSVSNDQAAAVQGAHVVYAKSWGPRGAYGDPVAGAAAVSAHPAWMVDRACMAKTDGGVFMHCLPVRRNVVVSDGVLDGTLSVVLDQAEARLHVQKATLLRAMGVSA